MSQTKKKNTTRALGGIAAIVKSELSSLIEVYKTVGDLYMWLRIKCIDHQLFVSFLYIPPGKLESDISEDTVFDQLLRDQALIRSKYSPDVAFATCGDTNLHTGTEDDMVPGDGSDRGPVADIDGYIADEYLPRYSKDSTCTRAGRIQLSYCQEGNLRILYGRVGKDKGIGEVTFSSNNVGEDGTGGTSFIDYVMLSADYMKNVTKFDVASNYLLSDHYPLLWSYKVAAFTPEARQKQVGEDHSDGLMRRKPPHP